MGSCKAVKTSTTTSEVFRLRGVFAEAERKQIQAKLEEIENLEALTAPEGRSLVARQGWVPCNNNAEGPGLLTSTRARPSDDDRVRANGETSHRPASSLGATRSSCLCPAGGGQPAPEHVAGSRSFRNQFVWQFTHCFGRRSSSPSTGTSSEASSGREEGAAGASGASALWVYQTQSAQEARPRPASQV